MLKDREGLVGLALLRSRDDGPTSEEERNLFAAIAPHVRAAVQVQRRLEGQGAALICGALESTTIAAFVCNGGGAVTAYTPAAEGLLAQGVAIRLRDQRLRAGNSTDDRRLQRCIGGMLNSGAAGVGFAGTIVIVWDATAQAPLALTLSLLPRRDFSLGCDPQLLIIARGPGVPSDRGRNAIKAAFDLSPAEVDVAVDLVAGRSRIEISTRRGVSIGTVKAQLKSIFRKTNVNRETELVALLALYS